MGANRQRAKERKVVTFLVLVSFCATTFPLPVANLELFDKDNSQPFLCQNWPCGCKTAEQCWTACCCFTPAERFAWAEKNGVTPPIYAERPACKNTAADRRSNDSRTARVTEEPKYTCCTPRDEYCAQQTIAIVSKWKTTGTGKSEGCAVAGMKSCKSCCQTSKADIVESKELNAPAKRQIVLSILALKCQGKGSAFTLLPWTILVTIQKVIVYEHESGAAYQVAAIDPASVYCKPDTPPPRVDALFAS